MKAAKFKYVAPKTLDEAIEHLSSDSDAKVLSGGQSLMPLLAMRLASPSILVDLQYVPGLAGIEEQGSHVRIGARATHRAVEHSALVASRLPMLSAAARHIAHPQIRSRGTFGGSAAHADPSGEWPTVLLALEGTMHVRGPRGSRDIHADSFFTGPFTTSMEAAEILTHVSIPTMRSAWSFQEAARKAGDYGLALVAAAATMSDGTIRDPRVAVGAAVGTVSRLPDVEQLLVEKAPSVELAEQAGRIATESVRAISDMHGSGVYRRELVGTLVRRAVIDVMNGV